MLLLPAAASAAPVTVEAESLATGSGGTFADTGASSDRALRIWSNGAATGTLQSRATRRISVRARAESCDGAPRMVVSVAGKVVLEQTVSASAWTEYAADVSLTDGAPRARGPAARPPAPSGPSTPSDSHPAQRADGELSSSRPADVAQLVEHFTRNEGVAGSSPAVGSEKPRKSSVSTTS